MKIVQINATCGIGSTGKICVGISELLTNKGVENYILCSKSNSYPLGKQFSNNAYTKVQALKSKVFGNYGLNSKSETKKMIAELDRINPDIVHLHNIHGHDCNLEMLFTYFKKKKTKLMWTFHDCWTFTGYCVYFDIARCDSWKTECSNCPQRKAYSFFFDRSKELFARKKELFEGLDLTIVTPSQWLADMVKQSFLKDYPIQVIYNGIDLDVFKPVDNCFKEKYDITNKKVVLGVAFAWGARKGLDVFTKIAEHLPNDYKIVLVGTNDDIDKQLPKDIISIHRTQNQKELAEIYTAADVFANPTREEVLGLVNIEALACGTPGVTFRTGGSPECYNSDCGSVVECDDIDALEREIIRICEDKPYSKENCIAKAQEFEKVKRFQEYVDLYERVLNR